MDRKTSAWKRRSSVAVAAIYFFANVALAHTPETTIWSERRRQLERGRGNSQDNILLASLNVPAGTSPLFQTVPVLTKSATALSPELANTLPPLFTSQHAELFRALHTADGTIRKVWIPADGPGNRVVVYIQDVHQNEEAQRHIASAVDSLLNAQQAGLVALEGAFAAIDVKAYHDFEDREVIGLTADCLLRENLITGPVHAAMTTKSPLPPIVGVDDPAHYNANVEAYQQSAPKIEIYKKELASRKFNLEKEKASVFSSELSAFDAKVTAYKEDRLPLSDYVVALAPKPGIGQAGLFIQALALEKSLDFQKVDSNRKILIEALVKNLNKSQVDQLVQESAGYRMGQVRTGEFYHYLQTLCRTAKVELSKFPAMEEYIHYVLLSDQIDAEKLMIELGALQKELYARLAKTQKERELVAQSTKLQLTDRLLNFALTPEEWAEYELLKSAPTQALELASFEAFYEEAHARDAALSDNLLSSMDTSKANTAVLVTGGYHSPGVAERLRQAGVTVVSFTPRIEKLDTAQGSAYLSIFTQEKTPLEKLFAGEKLFVSQDPGSRAIQTTAPLLATGIAALKKGIPSAERTIAWFNRGLLKVTVTVKNGTAFLKTIKYPSKERVEVRVESSPEGFRFTQTAIPAFAGMALAYYFFPILQSTISALFTVYASALTLDPFLNLLVAVTFLYLTIQMMPPSNALVSSNSINSPSKQTNRLFNRLTNAISLMSSESSNSGTSNETQEVEESWGLKYLKQRYAIHLLSLRFMKIPTTFNEILLYLFIFTDKSSNTDPNVSYMRAKMESGLITFIKETKQLSPREAFPMLKRFSLWLDFPTSEMTALKEMGALALAENTPSDIKEEIRHLLENRAQAHRKNEPKEIKQWAAIHEIIFGWSELKPRQVGDTKYTDFHVLVFLQFFLGDFLDSEQSFSILNFDLGNLITNGLDPHLNYFLKKVIKTHEKSGVARETGQGKSFKQAIASSKAKESFAFELEKNNTRVISNLLDNEVFVDRALYFLYLINQERLNEEETPSQLTKKEIESMLENLETRIRKLHPESKEFVKPPQATWLSSKIIGHALYFGVAWAVAAFLGVDMLAAISNHWVASATLVIATWPLSAFFTGWNSVASLWEARKLIKDQEGWVLNHQRVKEGSLEFFALTLVGVHLQTTYQKNGFWAMIKEHNKYNFSSNSKDITKQILANIESVNQGKLDDLSARTLLQAAIKTPNLPNSVVQKLAQLLRVHFNLINPTTEDAMKKLLMLATGGLDTPRTAMVLLDNDTLINPEKLQKVVASVKVLYSGGTIRFILGQQESSPELDNLVAGQKNISVNFEQNIFSEGKVNLNGAEKHLTNDDTAVHVYCPDGYDPVYTDRLTKENVDTFESLFQWVERLREIARFIAQQA